MKRGDLILLVLFLGCSPHFQSGKTQCSDYGECPDGFTCFNNGSGNYCYDSANPLGSGGGSSGGWGGSGGVVTTTTGGQGGGNSGASSSSGGTGGSCTNPSYPVHCDTVGTVPAGCWGPGTVCSTITNCGTAAAPDYQACGIAGYHPDCAGTKCIPNTGGSGGSGGGTGGAGGTTGCGAIDPTCSSIATDTCGTCLAECCCSTVILCVSSTSCTNLLSCESGCTTSSCESGCVSLYPSGESSLNSLLSCTVTNCTIECGSGGSTGSGGSSGGTGGRGGSSGGTGGTGTGGSGASTGSSGTCPAPLAGGTCNVFPACGCPTGQVCYPNTQATGLTCRTTAGLGEGAACNGKGCASGFGCFGGVCKKYCQLDSDCPAVDTARSCDQTYWDSVNAIAGVSVCSRVCDPVYPQNPRSPLLACPVGFGCLSMDTYPGTSDCESQSGTGITGTVCATDADCSPGYYCSNGGTCIKYCYTVADCPTGQTCVSFSTANYAGTTQVNHCHSP